MLQYKSAFLFLIFITMNHFEKIIEILFSSSCQNSETKPHNDGILILKNLKLYLEKFGVEVSLQEYQRTYDGNIFNHANLIAKKMGSVGPYIALQGHIDTVPCDEPYKYLVTDTEIIGRGAVDMKGPIAGLIVSFLNTINTGSGNVVLIITDDEETDFMGIEKLILEKDKFLPEILFCINAEPTKLQPSFFVRGFAQYEISAIGYSAHSSSSKNIFLIEKLIPVISAVGEYLREVRKISDPVYGDTRAAFTMLNSGKKTNQLPSDLNIVFNMRIVLKDLTRYKILFDKIIRSKCDSSIKINELFFEPFESLAGDSIKDDLKYIFNINNLVYSESIMHAFTESYMFNKAGIPCFSWGPGDMELAHVVPSDEIIKISDIKLYSKLLTSFIEKNNGILD